MNANSTLRPWVAALSITIAGPVAAATPFDEAMDAYAHQHFRAAFDRLAPLADEGHGPSARIALLMVSHGPRLFGERFEVPRERRDRWLTSAAQDVREALGRGSAP